jgi:hypothetical protein
MDLDARHQRVRRGEYRHAQRRADHALARALAVILGCGSMLSLGAAGLGLLLDRPPVGVKIAAALGLIQLLAAVGVACWDVRREVEYQHWLKRQG